MPFIALLLSLLLCCSPLWAQIVTKGKPDPTVTKVSQTPKLKDGTALLEKAKAKQCNTATPPKITTFQGEFDVTLMDYSNPESVTKIKGRIRQFWAKRPRKIGKSTTIQTAYRRELSTDLATERQVLAADWDNVCWRKKILNKSEKETIYLNQTKHKQEKADLLSEKRRIKELFGLIVLNQLEVKPGTVKIEAENQEIRFRVGKLKFKSIATRLAFEDKRGYGFRLWIDNETLHPMRAQVRWPARKSWEQFDLAQHFETTLPDNKTKLFVPCNIVYYQGGRPILEATAGQPQTAFNFNTLDDKKLAKLFPVEEDF